MTSPIHANPWLAHHEILFIINQKKNTHQKRNNNCITSPPSCSLQIRLLWNSKYVLCMHVDSCFIIMEVFIFKYLPLGYVIKRCFRGCPKPGFIACSRERKGTLFWATLRVEHGLNWERCMLTFVLHYFLIFIPLSPFQSRRTKGKRDENAIGSGTVNLHPFLLFLDIHALPQQLLPFQ